MCSRVTVTALCSMDFSSFPLDTQNCSLELESCKTHTHMHTHANTVFSVLLFSMQERALFLFRSLSTPLPLHPSPPSDAYNENDLMLYWKNGNDSLRTDEIVLSQFFIEQFQASSGLAFYSSTGVCVCDIRCVCVIKLISHYRYVIDQFNGQSAPEC